MNSIICVNSVISGEIGDNGTEIISVKLLTASVNHDVAGSSPAGGAIYVVRKDYYTQKSLIFKDFSCF